MTRALILALCLLGVLVTRAPAQALTVTETRATARDFNGATCGSRSNHSVLVPAGARLTGSSPRSGATLDDDDTGEIVARLTKARVRVNGKRAVRFTATGSDDACANPAAYEDLGWGASLVPLSLSYRVKRRVYFRSYIMGTYIRARSRPRTILFGNRTGIQRIRWSRWNGKVARGRGTLLYNDCVPNCAQARAQYFRVAIKLSRPRKCGGRYDYMRFAFRYIGAKPRGPGRTYAERHSCRPSGEVGPP